MVQHRFQPRFGRFILCQHPRRGFVDVFVAALGEIHNHRQRVRVAIAVHQHRILRQRVGDHLQQLRVHRVGVAGRAGNLAVKIFARHRHRAVDQIAQRVGEVGVVGGDKALVSDGAILRKRHLGQQIVPHRIGAEPLDQIVRIQHIAARFAHLVLAGQQPRVTEDLLGQRLAQRHQHDGPVNAVEPHNVLADHMQIRRPVVLVFVRRPVGMIPNAGDVVGQRIDPYINHMLVIEGDRNPPFEGGAGHAQIRQSGL